MKKIHNILYFLFFCKVNMCGSKRNGENGASGARQIIADLRECPSINGYFPQSLRQIRILILEILQCIPVVNPDDIGHLPPLKVRDFRLELAKTISFLDGH